MARIAAVYFVFHVCLVALMPPGLCPCWLANDPVVSHAHFSSDEPGHSHDYLRTVFPGAGSPAVLDARTPTSVLVGAAAAGGVLMAMISQIFFGRDRCFSPPHPPPEYFAV